MMPGLIRVVFVMIVPASGAWMGTTISTSARRSGMSVFIWIARASSRERQHRLYHQARMQIGSAGVVLRDGTQSGAGRRPQARLRVAGARLPRDRVASAYARKTAPAAGPPER